MENIKQQIIDQIRLIYTDKYLGIIYNIRQFTDFELDISRDEFKNYCGKLINELETSIDSEIITLESRSLKAKKSEIRHLTSVRAGYINVKLSAMINPVGQEVAKIVAMNHETINNLHYCSYNQCIYELDIDSYKLLANSDYKKRVEFLTKARGGLLTKIVQELRYNIGLVHHKLVATTTSETVETN